MGKSRKRTEEQMNKEQMKRGKREREYRTDEQGMMILEVVFFFHPFSRWVRLPEEWRK
jgi:hypothetical protein